MLYEIIKVTVIDSIHEEKTTYCKVNAFDEDIRLTIIPELNKLADAINMNYKLIQSVKRVHFVIKPVSTLNIADAVLTINMDIDTNIHSYNASAAIANRRSSVHNKRVKDEGIQYPIIELIDRRGFNNPFVNYNIVYVDAKTGDYMALGRE
jgi:hypothetical protein